MSESSPAASRRTTSRAARWRAASLIGVHLLAGLHLLHWRLAGRTLAPVEPSEAFDTIHLGVVTVGFLFLAGAVVATAVGGRFFCGWGCHILALQDLCAWILKRLRIKPVPIRSRVLVWIPPLAAIYLFVWPQVERLWRSEPMPQLHVVTDPEGWTSFTTDDLLRSFPGVTMTLITFAVCGFAIVYFLGSRSFCWYACPYGAIFAVADRVSPLRVIDGPGECSSCGLCTAGCSSNVRVIEEVRLHGKIIDTGCMKDLDCVSVCPTGAIQIGLTTPAFVGGAKRGQSIDKRYDFTVREDLAMVAIVLVTLPILRGLYDAISLLLALAVVALVAYFAVIAARLVVRPDVSLGAQTVKANGALTTTGRALAVAVVAGAALLGHSAVVRYHVYAGEYAATRVEAGNSSDLGALYAAIDHLDTAAKLGLVTPPGLVRQLASLNLRAGKPDEARRHLNALLANDPANLEARVGIARTWMIEGRTDLAERMLVAIIDRNHTSSELTDRNQYAVAAAYQTLGDLFAGLGRLDEAKAAYSGDLKTDPDFDSER